MLSYTAVLSLAHIIREIITFIENLFHYVYSKSYFDIMQLFCLAAPRCFNDL